MDGRERRDGVVAYYPSLSLSLSLSLSVSVSLSGFYIFGRFDSDARGANRSGRTVGIPNSHLLLEYWNGGDSRVPR